MVPKSATADSTVLTWLGLSNAFGSTGLYTRDYPEQLWFPLNERRGEEANEKQTESLLTLGGGGWVGRKRMKNTRKAC